MPNFSPANAFTAPDTFVDIQFNRELCEALFAEILINDEIDMDAELPERIEFNYTQRQFASYFEVSRELWTRWLDRDEFVRITDNLYRDRWINADDRLLFKHIRARFKHLRFAYAAFGDRHRYPLFFDAITSVMGNLQDAFKNDKGNSVRRNARLLRFLLNPLMFGLVLNETRRFHPSSREKFHAYMTHQMRDVAKFLEKDLITAKDFHDTRKIVSRYRACYATIKTLEHSPYHKKIAGYLATINGLMGNQHDLLMANKLNGTLDYHRDKFVLHDEIRQRLQNLVSSVL